MDALVLLYQLHVQQTTSSHPPFTHCVEIKGTELNMQLIDSLYANQLHLKQFIESCKTDFEKLNLAYGSVHLDPSIWVRVAIKTAKSNKNNSNIVFPNGCCIKKDCPLNVMYEIALNKMMK